MKRLLGIFLTIVIVLNALASMLVVYYLIDSEISNSLKTQVHQIHDQVRQRFRIFDELIAGDEKEIRAHATNALPKIANTILAKYPDPELIPSAELEELATSFGVDAIYVIDKNTKVVATNFLPDLNFELGTISDSFRTYLAEFYSSGKLEVDRINVSSKTGIVQIYAYYGPKGSDYLVEVSYDVKKYLSRNRSSRYVDFLFGDFFGEMVHGSVLLKNIDVYLVNNYAAFPFLNNTLPMPLSEMPKITEDGVLEVAGAGDSIHFYSQADLDRSKLHSANYLVIKTTFNLSPVSLILSKLTSISLLLLLIVLASTYTLLALGFDRWVVKRIDELIKVLELNAEGDYSKTINVQGKDELSRIGHHVNLMQGRLKEREEQLFEIKNTLEQRVAERTESLQAEVEARQLAEVKLKKLATTDPLTGVLNRRAFEDICTQELRICKRHNRPLSIVLMDLDFFKEINDQFGHHMGDNTLVSIAEQLRKIIRPQDHICRHGGEEFIVLMPDSNERQAFHLAERLRQSIESTKIISSEFSIKITASFGVSMLQRDEETLKPTIQRADRAMYVAKSSGRNKVECYHLGNKEDESHPIH